MTKKKVREDGSIDLRVDLKSPASDTLLDIMTERQLQTYAEAVRYCILETSTKTEFQLEELYWDKIKQYLEFDYVKSKLRLYNTASFINCALEDLFIKINKVNDSILNFDVRTKLNKDELEIALAFIHCQENSYSKQVMTTDVVKSLNKRNVKLVSEILESFVDKGILRKIVSKGIEYYHAEEVKDY